MEIMLSGLLVFFAAPLLTSASNVTDMERGLIQQCHVKGTNATCCATFGQYVFTPRNVCVTLEVRLNEMKVFTHLTVNEEKYFTGETGVNEICFPILPTLRGCFQTYRIDGSLMDKRLEACFKVKLSGIIIQVSQDLNCIGFKNGNFYFNNKPNIKNK